MGEGRGKLALVVVASAIILTSCGASRASGGTTLVAEAAATGQPAPHFLTGQRVRVANTWLVTVTKVATGPGDPAAPLKAGDVEVIITIALTNLTKTPLSLSSILQFRLVGADGIRYEESIATNLTPPDGMIDPGVVTTGQVAYETPATLKTFTFGFQPDTQGREVVTWDVTIG